MRFHGRLLAFVLGGMLLPPVVQHAFAEIQERIAQVKVSAELRCRQGVASAVIEQDDKYHELSVHSDRLPEENNPVSFSLRDIGYQLALNGSGDGALVSLVKTGGRDALALGLLDLHEIDCSNGGTIRQDWSGHAFLPVRLAPELTVTLISKLLRYRRFWDCIRNWVSGYYDRRLSLALRIEGSGFSRAIKKKSHKIYSNVGQCKSDRF